MNRGGLRDRRIITGIPIIMLSLCGSNPDVSMDFKNSGRSSLASLSDISVSMDLWSFEDAGIMSINLLLILLTDSLSGAKIPRSDIQSLSTTFS